MSGLIDGVNKVFLVFHRRDSMNVEGHKSFRDLVEGELQRTRLEYDYEDHIEWLKKLKDEVIPQAIIDVRKDWEEPKE